MRHHTAIEWEARATGAPVGADGRVRVPPEQDDPAADESLLRPAEGRWLSVSQDDWRDGSRLDREVGSPHAGLRQAGGLDGKDGTLKQLSARLVEQAFQAEMAEYLGHVAWQDRPLEAVYPIVLQAGHHASRAARAGHQHAATHLPTSQPWRSMPDRPSPTYLLRAL